MADRKVAKRVTTDLVGGLGNQLFQYAVARTIALKTGAVVTLNLEWFDAVQFDKKNTVRRYALSPFDLPVELKRPWPGRLRIVYWLRSARSLLRRVLSFVGMSKIIRERKFSFDSNILRAEPPVRLIGYWQSWKYFDDVATVLRKEIGTPRRLSQESAAMMSRIVNSDAICVHIRRGDYISNPVANQAHGTCSLAYYQHGLDYVSASLERPHVFVFTDDVAWSCENFSTHLPLTVVDINPPERAHEDLWLMAACRHFVIANSSLSWWGAWLSLSAGKKVVCPDRWFNNVDHDTSDLLPPDWVRM